MKKLLLISIVLIVSKQSVACVTDYECPYGARCLQSYNGAVGFCVKADNKPQAHFDTSMYQQANQIDPAASVQDGQDIRLRQLEMQKRQLEIQRLLND